MFNFLKKLFHNKNKKGNETVKYSILTGNGVLFKNGRIGIMECDKSCITIPDEFHPKYIKISLYNPYTLENNSDDNYDIISIGELKNNKYINVKDFSLKPQIFVKKLQTSYFSWYKINLYKL